jgi:hypothetical protein
LIRFGLIDVHPSLLANSGLAFPAARMSRSEKFQRFISIGYGAETAVSRIE